MVITEERYHSALAMPMVRCVVIGLDDQDKQDFERLTQGMESDPVMDIPIDDRIYPFIVRDAQLGENGKYAVFMFEPCGAPYEPA